MYLALRQRLNLNCTVQLFLFYCNSHNSGKRMAKCEGGKKVQSEMWNRTETTALIYLWIILHYIYLWIISPLKRRWMSHLPVSLRCEQRIRYSLARWVTWYLLLTPLLSSGLTSFSSSWKRCLLSSRSYFRPPRLVWEHSRFCQQLRSSSSV